MKGKTIIKRDGTIITEVLEREGQDCAEVYKLTEHLGAKTGEDVTGPDCDTAIETSTAS